MILFGFDVPSTGEEVLGLLGSMYNAAAEGLSPVMAYGLMVRAVALVAVVALASWMTQAGVALGPGGVHSQTEIQKSLGKFPFLARLWYFPSLFIINQSVAFIKFVVFTGIVASLATIYGGPWTPFCIGYLYLIFLSLAQKFPWDTLMLELMFVMTFLPPLRSLSGVFSEAGFDQSSLEMAAAPAPLNAFLLHLLCFRLMYGFGKIKFKDSKMTTTDSMYNKHFFVNQPIPAPVGFYGYHLLPTFVHRASLWFLYIVEIIVPFGMFIPGAARFVSGVSTIALMVSIQAGGNFGYFNILTAAMSFSLLDSKALIFTDFDLASALSLGSRMGLPLTLYSLFIIIFCPLYFIGSSWVTHGIVYWPVFDKASAPIRAIVAFLRRVNQFQVIAGYGVFPSTALAPQRLVCVFEGSHDGVTWSRFKYQYLPSATHSKPCIIAPHHPRLDHALYYEGPGTGPLLVSPFFLAELPSTPHKFAEVVRVAGRLLEGSNNAVYQKFVAPGPFPDPSNPPKWVRASLYQLRPASVSHALETGEYWTERRVGFNWPPINKEFIEGTRFFQDPIPDANLVHFDLTHWRPYLPMTPITEDEYSSVWHFVGEVREAAARVAGTTAPHPTEPLSFEESKRLFNFKTLPGVVAELRSRHSLSHLFQMYEAVSRVTTPLFDRMMVLYHRPGLEKSALQAELEACAGKASEPVWESKWKAMYLELTEITFTNPAPGKFGGILGSAFNIGLMSYVTVLCGGQRTCELAVGGKDSFVAAPRRGVARLAQPARAAFFRDSNSSEFNLGHFDIMKNMDLMMFFYSLFNYDAVARDATKSLLLHAMFPKNVENFVKKDTTGGGISGAFHAVQSLPPRLPMWDPIAKAMVPYLEDKIDTWQVSQSGVFSVNGHC